MNNFETLSKNRYFITNEFNEPISFDFTIESQVNTLKPHYFFKKGLEILIKLIDESMTTFDYK